MEKENKPCEKKLAKNAKNKTEPFAKQPQPQAKKKERKNMQKKIINTRFKRNLTINRKSSFLQNYS